MSTTNTLARIAHVARALDEQAHNAGVLVRANHHLGELRRAYLRSGDGAWKRLAAKQGRAYKAASDARLTALHADLAAQHAPRPSAPPIAAPEEPRPASGWLVRVMRWLRGRFVSPLQAA